MNFLSSLPFFPLSYFPYPPSDLPVFLTPPQMISIRARPVPEQFNVWDISVFDPTLYYSECMTFGVTLIEDKTYLFSSSVANFCPAFWQRARAKGLTDEDDLYNPHALDDSWQIGCNSDVLREINWVAFKQLVYRFLKHLRQQVDDNPLLYPWIKQVTTINGVDLDIQLWEASKAPKVSKAPEVSQPEIIDLTCDH